MNDEIVLTLPEERAYRDVAHLVVGGLAVRLNLTLESLEDLQVALEGLLPHVHGEATISIAVRDGGLDVTVGPFGAERLRAELDREEPLALRRVLATVADDFELLDREDSAWVKLTKAV